jgi:peptidoglycan/xylan/chitin deacetylase (PgdA/CDA1 family)
MYHDISPDNMLAFRRHMTFLYKKYKFIDPITFDEMMQGKRPMRGLNILLTFDDGFKSNYAAAETILKEMGIKAVFFITPNFINCRTRNEVKAFVAENLFLSQYSPDKVPDYMEPMSWEELAQLNQDGHCIGSHTLSHPRLSQLTDMNIMKKEIIESGELLQERIGTSIDFFAYPFGKVSNVDKRFFEIAAKRYRYLFSGVRGFNSSATNRLAIRRDDINLNETTAYLQFIIEGGLSIYHKNDRRNLDEMVRQVRL